MAVSSHNLASALAARLDAVVPDSLRVRSVGANVNVYVSGTELVCGTPESRLVEDAESPVAESIEIAVTAVVNSVQDCVAETLGKEWPVLPEGGMALLGTRTEGDHIHIWFGKEDAPVLLLPPIQIAPGFPALAAELATRLNNVVPNPFSVRAEGTEVNVYDSEELFLCGRPASELIQNDQISIAETIESTVKAVVNTVQDCLVEALGQEWPRLREGGLALLGTRMDGDSVHVWFGNENSPVLRLSPIRIADVSNRR